jgi:hypothetical protein
VLPPPGSQDPYANMHLVATVPERAGAGPFRLWVGDLASATEWDSLAAAGITHVVNCCVADLGDDDKRDWTPFAARGIQYAVLHTQDMRTAGGGVGEDPSGQWPAVMALMREAMAWPGGGGVLVHCFAGKNRSVTTAAVFMALHHMAPSFAAAVDAIRAARPAAAPMPRYLAFGERFVAHAARLPPYRVPLVRGPETLGGRGVAPVPASADGVE